MNIGNILKVADAIQAAELVAQDIGFSMGSLGGPPEAHCVDLSGHSCGTVACIAGTAVAVLEGVEVFRKFRLYSDERAAPLLGLTRVGLFDGQAGALFFPNEACRNEITPMHAARALRILAITGKVDWIAAMKTDEPIMPALPTPVTTRVTA